MEKVSKDNTVKPVFVFGSNLQGRHGKGAALFAVQNHGAIYGCGRGRQGNSYAIPTKSTPYEVLKLTDIDKYVSEFLGYAREHPELTFEVTPIGTGLAGFKHEEIAPLFKYRTSNCIMPKEWEGLYDIESV